MSYRNLLTLDALESAEIADLRSARLPSDRTYGRGELNESNPLWGEAPEALFALLPEEDALRYHPVERFEEKEVEL